MTIRTFSQNMEGWVQGQHMRHFDILPVFALPAHITDRYGRMRRHVLPASLSLRIEYSWFVAMVGARVLLKSTNQPGPLRPIVQRQHQISHQFRVDRFLFQAPNFLRYNNREVYPYQNSSNISSANECVRFTDAHTRLPSAVTTNAALGKDSQIQRYFVRQSRKNDR
jgi:hypothetical protein